MICYKAESGFTRASVLPHQEEKRTNAEIPVCLFRPAAGGGWGVLGTLVEGPFLQDLRDIFAIIQEFAQESMQSFLGPTAWCRRSERRSSGVRTGVECLGFLDGAFWRNQPPPGW